MKQSVKERLIIFIKKNGLSQRRFEETVGISNGYVNSLRHAPSATKLQMIIDAFPQLNEKWLLTGDGEMLKSEIELPKKSMTSGKPYYDVEFEMGFDEMTNDQTTSPEYLIDFRPYNHADVWCNAWGNSMSPTINSGDIIALKEITDARYVINGEIYAIVTLNGLRTIKRINDNGDTYTLIPDNVDYKEQTIDKKEIIKMFLVIGCMKRFNY